MLFLSPGSRTGSRAEADPMQTSSLLDVGPTKVVTFSHLSVRHGCSTRVGGVSQAPWNSLNTGFTVHDDPADVWENRRRFAACLGLENLTWLLSMSHGRDVVRVDTAPPLPVDRRQPPRPLYAADACVTDRPGVPLSLTVADCVPVFFHDPVRRCIGLAHAGWRGTVAGIVEATVRTMVEEYGCRPSDLRVGIGPSIGPDAFEVGPEVLAAFETEFPERPEVIVSRSGEGKGRVDLWQANAEMARRAGVLEAHIEVSGWCTASCPELFFSHRRDQGQSGRLLAAIVL